METSILKDFVEKIEQMAQPNVVQVEGKAFCRYPLHRIKPEEDTPEPVSVAGLDSLVKLILVEGVNTTPPLFVRVNSFRSVEVFSNYRSGENTAFLRYYLYNAKADVPEFSAGWRSQEKAIIELQSIFGETEDRAYLLDLLSRMTVSEGATTADNGVTQEVTARAGVQLKETVPVRPIVRLQPYRTFLEVAQPASAFLLRVDSQGKIGLFEADGGVWKLEAKQNVADYLASRLEKEIAAGKVCVMV